MCGIVGSMLRQSKEHNGQVNQVIMWDIFEDMKLLVEDLVADFEDLKDKLNKWE